MINKLKKRIYLLLEVQQRELDARIIFAIKAANLGYSIVFCKKAYLFSKSKYLINGIVILKSIGVKNYEHIRTLKKNGHIVCSFDEEGLLFHDSEKYCKRRLNEKCLSELKYFFAWGKNDYDAIKSYYPHFIDKVKIAGNSRIELLKKPLNKIYEIRAKKIKEKYGSFILINTKFGYSNYMSQRDNYSIVDGLNKVWNLNEDEIHFYNYILKSQIKRRDDIIEILRIFDKKYPNIKFFIRPHQSENPTFWAKIKNKNVVIVQDGSPALDWMIAAKVSISFNCTTAIEGKFFNVNHINYIPMDKNDFKLPNEINKNIYNIEDLEKEIIKNFNNNFDTTFSKKIDLKNYIENINSDYVENIISILKDEYDHIRIREKDKYINFFCFNYFRFKRLLLNLYYFKIQKKNKDDLSILLKQKNPKTSISMIKGKSEKFMINLGIKNIKIHELYPDVYCFEKEIE